MGKWQSSILKSENLIVWLPLPAVSEEAVECGEVRRGGGEGSRRCSTTLHVGQRLKLGCALALIVAVAVIQQLAVAHEGYEVWQEIASLSSS